jgi:hypothetical protein
MSKEQVKLQIDTDITGKTAVKSITPTNVGENMKDIVDLIPEDSYKVYTALLSCTDSATPVLNILKNTIGNIIWTRNSAGNYGLALTGAFIIGKTITFTSINNGYSIIAKMSTNFSTDTIYLETYDPTTLSNIDYIQHLGVEIRVYN